MSTNGAFGTTTRLPIRKFGSPCVPPDERNRAASRYAVVRLMPSNLAAASTVRAGGNSSTHASTPTARPPFVASDRQKDPKPTAASQRHSSTSEPQALGEVACELDQLSPCPPTRLQATTARSLAASNRRP